MTIYQFSQLSDDGKFEALSKEGFVADRKLRGCDVYLFQIDSFYVEVYCHRERHEFDHYRAFCSTDKLEPYLEQIDISSLYSMNG